MNNCVELVYRNDVPTPRLRIPDAMGVRNPDQGIGTDLERLAEIAGRVCYDSFGKGRNSEDYHKHILEVGHLSVLEHCVFTIELPWRWNSNDFELLMEIQGVPGIHIEFTEDTTRVTVNLRTVLDWGRHTNRPLDYGPSHLYQVLYVAASGVAPQIVPNTPDIQEARDLKLCHDYKIVSPLSEDEKWVTLWLRGSRGFSHELVRHGDFTAISQRSTRYVDESKSDMCWHPLLKSQVGLLSNVSEAAGLIYESVVEELMAQGHDRKAARGAARGVLPNALETQLIFSASIKQWRHIFSMRCSKYADGEIRAIMCEARDIILPNE